MTVLRRATMWVLAAMILTPALASAQAAQLPEGPGQAIIQNSCVSCHAPGIITAKRVSRAEWEGVIARMVTYGSFLRGDDTATLLDYLVANFGPAAGGADSPAETVAANERYEVDREWAKLPEGTTWGASTSSIAADGKGNVVVLVRTAPYFRVFNRDGQLLRTWGDAGLFQQAHSVMFDNDGFLWATDNTGHVVHKFTADGTLLMTLGQRGMAGDNTSRDLLNGPDDVAIAANGDIYVSDGYNNARIIQFNRDGQFIRIIGGTQGAGNGELQLPHGVAVDSQNRILVGDSANSRVSVFGANGGFIESWAFPSRGGMLITADDTVYVSDVDAGGINIVKNGELVEFIGGLGRIHGISLDSDGAIYASDSANQAVMKITPR